MSAATSNPRKCAEADPLANARSFLETIRRSLDKLSQDELAEFDLTVSRAISLVRRRVNGRAPVSYLPPEVLGLVFDFVLSWPTLRQDSPSWASYPSQIHAAVAERVRLSHVCQQWRSVALGTASLWSLVEACRGGLADEFLARSHDIPIQVLIEHGLHRSSEELQIPNSRRIAGLVLCSCQSRVEDPLVPPPHTLSVTNVLNLEYLLMKNNLSRYPEFRFSPPINLDTLVNIFPNGTPSLKRLYLDDQTWFPNVSYESLTHLHISHGSPIKLSSFLPLLRRCASLEELVLNSVYLEPHDVLPSDAVLLPNLRLLTLILGESGMRIERLLQHLILPERLSLRMLGDQASEQLQLLDPLPELPFTRTLKNVLIDYDPVNGSSGTCTVKATSAIRTRGAAAFGSAASEQCSGHSPSTGSSLLLTYNSIMTRYAPFIDITLLLPCHAVEQLAYRTRLSFEEDPTAGPLTPLPANVSLPSLKVLRFLDATVPAVASQMPEDYQRWAERILERLPPVPELEIWSANARLLAVLNEPGCKYLPKSVKKLTFFHVQPPRQAGVEGDTSSDWDDRHERETKIVHLDATHLQQKQEVSVTVHSVWWDHPLDLPEFGQTGDPYHMWSLLDYR